MKREFYSCENCEKKFVGHYNLKTHVCQKEPSVIEETNVSLRRTILKMSCRRTCTNTGNEDVTNTANEDVMNKSDFMS